MRNVPHFRFVCLFPDDEIQVMHFGAGLPFSDGFLVPCVGRHIMSTCPTVSVTRFDHLLRVVSSPELSIVNIPFFSSG